MELAECLVHWTPELVSRVRCPTTSSFMMHVYFTSIKNLNRKLQLCGLEKKEANAEQNTSINPRCSFNVYLQTTKRLTHFAIAWSWTIQVAVIPLTAKFTKSVVAIWLLIAVGMARLFLFTRPRDPRNRPRRFNKIRTNSLNKNYNLQTNKWQIFSFFRSQKLQRDLAS